MQTVVERMNAARDLAAEKTKALGLAISPLVAALQVQEDGKTGYPVRVFMQYNQRSWSLYFGERNWDEGLSVEELAHQVVAWVQGGLDSGLLSLEDRPLEWIDIEDRRS